MRTIRLALCTVLLCTTGCNRQKTENVRDLLVIAGCWKGVQVSTRDQPRSLWNSCSLRPDSSLALSMIYEIGPRSRVWAMDGVREFAERLRFRRSLQCGYGYHWRQAETRIHDRVVHSCFIPGDGNQILGVFPELVVVFTAGNYGRDPKPDYFSLMEKFIPPATGPQG